MTRWTLAAAMSAGVLVFGTPAVSAEDNAPPSTATRPAKVLPDQTSTPNHAAPPATTTQTTGQAPHDPTIKEMNETEKTKVDTKGK
jgi:hypothetical protein